MWSASFAWPLVALHLAVLPDGQVLSYGSPLGQGVQDGRTFDRWNPLTANVAQGHTTIPNSATVDSFCAAGVLQTGGAMLVSGGDSNASPGNLSKNSTVFNYTVNTASTQSSVMAQNRWYASMIKLADGRTMITGGGLPYVTEAYANPAGNLNNVSMTPEVWTPGTGWSSLTGISVSNGGRDAFGPDFNRWWYPRNWVAPNGQVFGISAEKMWFLNPAGTGSITFVGNFKTGYNNTTRPNVGPTSTAVMYDIGKNPAGRRQRPDQRVPESLQRIRDDLRHQQRHSGDHRDRRHGEPAAVGQRDGGAERPRGRHRGARASPTTAAGTPCSPPNGGTRRRARGPACPTPRSFVTTTRPRC